MPDFYHTVRMSNARARSNAFGRSVRFRDVAHLAATRRLREQRPDIQDNTLVRALQATLPMGDTNATDYGQLAHLGVLREGEALDESAYVSCRSSPPAGDLWQVVMIDDHMVVQVYESTRTARSADEVLLMRVEAAYAGAGLEPKIAKRFRFADEFNAIGARIDGRDAWVSATAELLLVGLALSVCLVSSG